MEITQLRNTLEYRKGERAKVLQNLESFRKDFKRIARELDQHSRALEIVKLVGLKTQKALEYHLAEQVSLAQAAIFDDPYSLEIHFHEKRGQSEAELFYSREDLTIRPIGPNGQSRVGWGTIDVGAFALRIGYLTMRQDKNIRRVVLLDEPFARLKGYAANTRALALMNEIAESMNIQIIMISDERIPREDIIAGADRTFLVSKKKDSSQVRVL